MTEQTTLWKPDGPRLQRERAAARRVAAHSELAGFLRSLAATLEVEAVSLRMSIDMASADDDKNTLAGFADQLNKAAQYAAKLAADYRSKTP